MNTDETDSLVQENKEIIKAQLPGSRVQLTKHLCIKEEDVDYLQKLHTDPKSMLAKKQLKFY